MSWRQAIKDASVAVRQSIKGASVAVSLSFGSTLALIGVLLSSFILWFILFGRYQVRPFDSASWKAAAWKTDIGQHRDIRLRMIDDLLHRYNLVGMSRTQIVDLLGYPNPNESKQTSSEIYYYLGPERGFISIDDEWLDIKFQGDLVVSAIDRPD